MNKTKRYVSLALVGILTGSMIGCAQKDNSNTSSNTNNSSGSTNGANQTQNNLNNDKQSQEKPLEITYWSQFNAQDSGITSLGDVLWLQELEKKTHVKVTFKHPPSGQEGEQFNLMIAARDLPDVIEHNWHSYPGGPEKAIGDEVILKLNDVIDNYAPAYKKTLGEYPNAAKQLTTDQGSLFGFGALTVMEYKTYGGYMVRKDWLDELNLEVPETIEEWTQVLRQFKEKKDSTAPFTTTLYDLKTQPGWNGAFGVGTQFYLDGGSVKYGPMEPGYKEYLKFLNSWYREGLLDPDFASIDGKTKNANMLNGVSGAAFGWIGSTMGSYLDSAQDPNFDLAPAQFPVANKGDEPVFTLKENEFRGISAAITTACKDPEAVAKWLDYRYTEEGHMLKNFGVEGITYDMVGGKPVYTDLITKNPDGLNLAQSLRKYTQASYPVAGMDDPDYLMQYYKYPQQEEAAKIYSQYADNANLVNLPPISATEEETQELATLNTEIQTYVDEMFLKFIMGVESIENFDKFVEQLKKMKIERVIELRQTAVNRYNNR